MTKPRGCSILLNKEAFQAGGRNPFRRHSNSKIDNILNKLQVMLDLGASLVAQMVNNLPAVLETQVGILGQEDPLEKGTATDSRILAWRIP